MYEFEIDGITIGIIANAVGAPFAVLLAEQMFVSGCGLLISITSAGIINMPGTNPEYILITKSLRDEGTSYHYLPPSLFCDLPKSIKERSSAIVENKHLGVSLGTSWTTDAPYRETAEAIENAKAKNVNVVEMESAALYAFAQFKRKAVICFAHITNSMAQSEGDFEKGEKSGSVRSLELIRYTIKVLSTIS
jgi:uridine phosphorylase